MTDPEEGTESIDDVDEIDEIEDSEDEITEEESSEEDSEEEEEIDPNAEDLTSHLPVTIIDAVDENGAPLIPPWIQGTLTGIVQAIRDYNSAHAAQTGQHSESFIAWRSNLPEMTDDEKSAKELSTMTDLHNWLWTDATPAQLVAIRPMLDEMMLDVNRALMNRQHDVKMAERPAKIDLAEARETLINGIKGARDMAKQGFLQGLTEDMILGLPEIKIVPRKGTNGVYGFPSAPKVMSAATEKKKNGGKDFRQHNTQVRILVNGILYSNHPATLGGAATWFLHKSVKDAGKIFEAWKSGASWTDKSGNVFTWCYQQDAPPASDKKWDSENNSEEA
jgi:hypothetical protein